ncbi:MAG: hypothetical protein ACTS5R_01690 [Candidatus Hodgkinia cicadicola]
MLNISRRGGLICANVSEWERLRPAKWWIANSWSVIANLVMSASFGRSNVTWLRGVRNGGGIEVSSKELTRRRLVASFEVERLRPLSLAIGAQWRRSSLPRSLFRSVGTFWRCCAFYLRRVDCVNLRLLCE